MADDGVVDRVRKQLSLGLTPSHDTTAKLLAMLDQYAQMDPQLLERLAPLQTQLLKDVDRDFIVASVENMVDRRRSITEKRA